MRCLAVVALVLPLLTGPARAAGPPLILNHPALGPKQVAFGYAGFSRLYPVPLTGGPATELPLPMAEEASYAPDGKKLAYVPFTNTRGYPGSYIAWKKYRGGSAPFIWVANLDNSAVEKVPH